MIRTASLTLISVSIAAGCRPDPGEPDYPEFQRASEIDENFLPGPFPFEKGDERLSLGLFYEGTATEVIEIDGVGTNYFIYEGTYGQFPDEDRVEGATSDLLVMSDAQLWWGGGIIWSSGRDLSAWTTLHLSLKASDAAFEAMDLLVGGGGVEVRLKPTAYGFAADGEWHSLVIPLADFAGVDFTDVTIPASFVSDDGPAGAEIRIDDLYYTKE